MAFDELPPDPYKALGVSKDAKLPEIRSAHRKLVLKCHPDKVQDAALKAIKQDEFQKVQQAYELLGDDQRRLQYDEQVKLYALRREMGRGYATPRSNPFEYEVKNAEPRSTTYTYSRPSSKSTPKETTKVYPQQQRPKSYEDVAYEPTRHHPKKSASYESADRDQKSKPRSREEEKERERSQRRHEEDERARAKYKEESKRAYGEKKKRSEKEKKRGADDKYSSRAAHVEEESSDDYRAERAKDRLRQERHRLEEETRLRNEAARAEAARAEAARAEAAREAARQSEPNRQAPLTPKWDNHKEYARQYMQAAGRKAGPAPTSAEDFRPRNIQRAETFATPKYDIRYATPTHPQAAPAYPSEDEAPRRSSASRPSTRRASEAVPTSRGKDAPKSSSKDKEREKDREKERKRSERSKSRDPYTHIVDPAPHPPMPSLQTHSSAPPVIPSTRKEPSRSKTQEYPRSRDAGIPPLPRAATFQAGDHAQDRDTRGSRLKKTVNYSSESDSDSPAGYTTQRRQQSPPPSRRRDAQPETRYNILNGKTVPASSRGHRADMRNIDDEAPYISRDRSESPTGTSRHPRTSERPSLHRDDSNGTRPAPVRSTSQTYYHPSYATPAVQPEPIVRDVRPKMSQRETHNRGPAPGPYLDHVKYSSPLGPENVIYSRQGSSPSYHTQAAKDFAYAAPREQRSVYA